MSEPASPDLAALSDPLLAACLCAIDPAGLGGIVVRARAGPHRDRWLARLRELLPHDRPMRRLPLHADEHRIFGGLDLAATLAAGSPVTARGVLAEADGGLLLLSMAERVGTATAARLGAVLDLGQVAGPAGRHPAAIGIVALDEGLEPDEQPPAALLDRLAFRIDLDAFDPAEILTEGAASIEAARRRLAAVTCDDAVLRALCDTAAALGVDSLRAAILALRAARAVASLRGYPLVEQQDAALAARLVLAPRATRLPAVPDQAEAEAEPKPNPDGADPLPANEQQAEGETQAPQTLDDLVLSAAKAAIPPGLLERLVAGPAARAGPRAQGKAGALQASLKRGRPAGLRAAKPERGARLNLVATLRAAAPWQRLRARLADGTGTPNPSRRVEIRPADLRITRFKQRSETTTIFVVDASGSLALNRLAEAKGAIELLLAECYVRRDQVALLAFRGKAADLLLPPTRSLARAKRCLADLPGGGATPLATAIDAALGVADAVRRRGQTPVVVFLTDGRGNVARDGSTGRARADEDTRLAAQAARSTGIRTLLVDASPRPQQPAQALATAMGALYIAMPRAEAGALSRAVLAATTT